MGYTRYMNHGHDNAPFLHQNWECLHIQCCKRRHTTDERSCGMCNCYMLSVRGQYIHTVSHDSMYSKDTASEKYYTTATQMSHDCHMTYIVGTIKLNSQCLSAAMYEVCIASTFTSLNRKTSPRATQVAASLPSHIPHDCTGTPHSD